MADNRRSSRKSKRRNSTNRQISRILSTILSRVRDIRECRKGSKFYRWSFYRSQSPLSWDSPYSGLKYFLVSNLCKPGCNDEGIPMRGQLGRRRNAPDFPRTFPFVSNAWTFLHRWQTVKPCTRTNCLWNSIPWRRWTGIWRIPISSFRCTYDPPASTSRVSIYPRFSLRSKYQKFYISRA